MMAIVRKVIAWIGGLLAAVIIVVALAVSALRIIIPQVPEYRDQAVAWTSDLFGAPVDIDSLGVEWSWLRPELVLRRVRFVSADARTAFAAREVRIGLSLRMLLRHGRMAPAGITLVAPDLTVVIDAGVEADVGGDWHRAFGARQHRGDVKVTAGRVTVIAAALRERIEFTDVEARLSSDGLYHEASVRAVPGGGLGGQLHIVSRGRGWPGEPGWQATSRLETRGIDLVAWQSLVGRKGLQVGSLDFFADLEADRGELRHARMDIGLSGLRWMDNGAAPRTRVDRAAAEVVWERQSNGWRARLQQLVVGRGAGTQSSGALVISTDAPGLFKVNATDLALEDAVLLVEVLPFELAPALERMLTRAPRGRVATLDASIRRDVSGNFLPSVRLSAQALALASPKGAGIPGFSGVALDLDMDEGRGTAGVTIDEGSVDLPWIFRAPFQLVRTRITSHWSRGDGGWSISLPAIAVKNAAIPLEGTGGWWIGDDGARTMQMDTRFQGAQLASKSPYLPVSNMSENLVAWLDHGVQGGVATSGTFRYDGDVGPGAMREGRGKLDIEFDAAGIKLDFASGWPLLTGGDARVRFTGNSFEGEVSAGQVGQAAVRQARVSIGDFEQPELVITAASAGEFARMLETFRETPIGRADWLQEVEAGGRAELSLGIDLPLTEGALAKVRGEVTLDDARMSVGGFPHAVESLGGRVQFTEDSVTARSVRGRMLGTPLTVDADTTRNPDGTAIGMLIAFTGNFTHGFAARLAGRTDLPLQGVTRAKATLHIPLRESVDPSITVVTDFAGMAIDAPAPLGKPAAARRATEFRVALRPAVRPVTLRSSGALALDGELTHGAEGWYLARAAASIGGAAPGAIPPNGVSVTGHIEEWRYLTGQASMFPLAGVNLTVGRLHAWNRDFGRVSLDGWRDGDAWRWVLGGERAAGTLLVPDEPSLDAPVRVDLERIHLPVVDGSTTTEPVDPRRIPPVTFHAADFRFGVVQLGEVNGRIVPVENGVALDTFTATRPNTRIHADATWRTVDGFHRTTLRGTLDSTDVRRTLAALGYAVSMEAAAGHLQADLAWPSAPMDRPLAGMSGNAELRLERGNLVEVQPGAGRVFGLLSLPALPRRLALDFSDVYRRGLGFDSIQGKFRIEDGQAHTEDLRLRGPAARIEIKGRTGLATRDYDQEANVVGSLAASLTIAGALAGGPAVGAAMLIASELLKGPLEDMARVRYRITGPWENPVLERIGEPVREPR